jgi:MFS family permease
VLGLGRLIPMATTLFGLGLIALGLAHTVWLAMITLFFVGIGFMAQTAASNTLLQTLVRPEMRGRVMAFFTMAFMGTTPFGALAAGALAGRIGAPHTIMLGGATCLIGAAIFLRGLPALRAQVRPIYIERGILPPIVGVTEVTAVTEAAER